MVFKVAFIGSVDCLNSKEEGKVQESVHDNELADVGCEDVIPASKIRSVYIVKHLGDIIMTPFFP